MQVIISPLHRRGQERKNLVGMIMFNYSKVKLYRGTSYGICNGCPRDGYFVEMGRVTRARYHRAIRHIDRHVKTIRMNKMADAIVSNSVPQGSILGPLLFILYMNDICSVSKLLFTLLYADDTCVMLSGKYLNDLIAVLSVELISLSDWLKSNKLSLNTQNTFFHGFPES